MNNTATNYQSGGELHFEGAFNQDIPLAARPASAATFTSK
jgi:hypothetical protein